MTSWTGQEKSNNINIEVLFPDTAEVEKMVSSRGVNLFYKSVENRRLCCQVRKTNPLNGYLKTLDAWITSIRADQTEQRAESSKFEIDYLHGRMLKINPILDWTIDQVWDYVRKNDVPYNKLHDMGYPSIGCAPCTRAVEEGEDPRAGRWWWEQDSDKECGIHFGHEPQSLKNRGRSQVPCRRFSFTIGKNFFLEQPH